MYPISIVNTTKNCCVQYNNVSNQVAAKDNGMQWNPLKKCPHLKYLKKSVHVCLCDSENQL